MLKPQNQLLSISEINNIQSGKFFEVIETRISKRNNDKLN
jgi:hypothetical protein